MEQRLKKAERYRQLANRCADQAKAAELDYMGDFFRKIAVRYVLMAEDLETDPLARISCQNNQPLWERAGHFLTS